MPALLLVLLLILAPPAAGADCQQVDATVLDSHTSWALQAWRGAEQGRFDEAHQLLLSDLACLAGTGLRTRNTDLFVVLARGALLADDQEALLACFRAVQVIQADYRPPVELVTPGSPLDQAFALALTRGPDVAAFKRRYLGQQVTSAPPAASAPSPEQLAELQREAFLAQVQARLDTDQRARRAGRLTTTLGGITTGMSLSFLAAMLTSGANKPIHERPENRALMLRFWTGTAITGGVATGLGLWMMHASQLSGGPIPGLELRGRL